MKKIYAFLGVFMVYSITIKAQDIHFSQFNQSPLTVNPSLAGGFNGDMRIFANYKSQWASAGAPFKTGAFSYDMPLARKKWKNIFLGAGLLAFNDKAGESRIGTSQAALSFATHIMLNSNSSLSAGLTGAFVQKSMNYGNLTWDEQYDGKTFNTALASGEPAGSPNFAYADIGVGVNWTYGTGNRLAIISNDFKLNAGIAVYHLNRPRQSFYYSGQDRLHPKIVAHANSLITIPNSHTAVIPNILFLRQGSAQEILLGAMLRHRLKEDSRYTGLIKEMAISFGGHYRWNDAFIASAFFELANYALGISYDINTSGLRAATAGRGGLEIALRYVTPNPFGSSRVKPIYNLN